ncbi:hypothetical protein [Sphingomonas sp. LaA6.9]|uniref:hypothetical protein n=1 Tax=Sphingomonas sp. LaA6.9 TaxID=2919914 RepID=UPI001F50151A|nr:hypothetical protein [Sphingomonas sp. LaA6.9]MCJ8156988.1 hypothetical protein [Sphingomonas sp. LaA6.9]
MAENTAGRVVQGEVDQRGLTRQFARTTRQLECLVDQGGRSFIGGFANGNPDAVPGFPIQPRGASETAVELRKHTHAPHNADRGKSFPAGAGHQARCALPVKIQDWQRPGISASYWLRRYRNEAEIPIGSLVQSDHFTSL